FHVQGANTLTLNTSVFGSAGITKGGAGTLILGAVNNVGAYTGVTRINDGVLQIADPTRIGPGDIVLALGRYSASSSNGLNMTAATATLPNNIVLKDGVQNIALAAGASVTFNGNITGTGGVQLNSGTYVFAGSNTYTGPTRLFLSTGTVLL